MENRALTLFYSTIKSEETRKQYEYYLGKFVNFYKLRDIASIIEIEPKQLQIMIEDFVMDLKKSKSKSSIQGYVSALKAIIEINDIMINWGKIKRLYPEQGKRTGQRAWKREEIKRMLENCKNVKSRALVLFLTCGCRIGALPELTMKDIIDMPLNCKKVIVYRNTKYEYTTFLTPEAAKEFNNYVEKRKNNGERIDGNSPAFRAAYILGSQKVKPASKHSLTQIIIRLTHSAGLRDPATKQNGRYETQADHGFRKYFNTIAKTTQDTNHAIIEKMMGHNSKTIPLDTSYFDTEMIPEFSFNEFKKIMLNLTIDSSERDKTRIQNLESEKTELAKQQDKVNVLMDNIQSFINNSSHDEETKQMLKKLFFNK